MNKSTTFCVIAGLALWMGMPGCREAETPEGEEAAPAPVAEASAGKAAFPQDKATASISGKIMFDGDPPEPKLLRIQGDQYCEHHSEENPVLSETLLVNDDKTLRNVLVYVKSGADQWKFTPPGDPKILTQKGCTYVPHMFGIQVGQPLHVTSADDTTHNVHFIGKKNREFNLTQKKGQVDKRQFTREELGTAFFKCDIHSWMKAHVGILSHPFFAVTAEGGTFELGKLPPGEYEIEAWHETLGAKTQKVTVADGETATVEFTFAQ